MLPWARKINFMKGYASFCPIAKAAEVLAERWTLLILRDLLLGSRRFNEFRRWFARSRFADDNPRPAA